MGETQKVVYTAGELFADGSAIDLLSGGRLVVWQHGLESAPIAPELQLNFITYRPIGLGESTRRLLRLPSTVADADSLKDLVPDLINVIRNYSSLNGGEALLVAAFVLATWVGESLPSTPCLNLWGFPGEQTGLVALLECLCRRAINIVDPSVRELSKLAVGVLSTLILANPGERNLASLLATAGTPDAVILQGGKFINLRYATIVCTQEPVSRFAIRIRVLPSGRREKRLTSAQARALTEHFQPRLQAYRFNRQVAVSNSEVDAPDFEPEIRQMARTLGAALEGAWPRPADVAAALWDLDGQAKSKRSDSLAALALEALLALYHSKKSAAYVVEVADLVTTISIGRHEKRVITPRKVGSILRKKLGLTPDKSDSRGFSISYDNETASRIHRLAASYSVLSLSPGKGCKLCCQLWPPDKVTVSDSSATQVEAMRAGSITANPILASTWTVSKTCTTRTTKKAQKANCSGCPILASTWTTNRTFPTCTTCTTRTTQTRPTRRKKVSYEATFRAAVLPTTVVAIARLSCGLGVCGPTSET